MASTGMYFAFVSPRIKTRIPCACKRLKSFQALRFLFACREIFRLRRAGLLCGPQVFRLDRFISQMLRALCSEGERASIGVHVHGCGNVENIFGSESNGENFRG
jgi:hypothetical protein